jgi:hypothetical protein
MAGLLDEKEDNYYKDLKSRFDYLSHKYQIEEVALFQFSFLSIDQIIFQQYDFRRQVCTMLNITYLKVSTASIHLCTV